MAGKTKSGNSTAQVERTEKLQRNAHLPHALHAAVLSRKEKIIQFHIFNDIYDWDPTARAKLC